MSTYDKYYKEDKDYFGTPNTVLIDFFSSQEKKNKLIDLGAGQGRNSIPLHDLGYMVTAIDLSQVGLDQIKTHRPSIQTICNDIYTLELKDYDYILMDSMLHFYKNDVEKETKLVNHILKQMNKDAIFVNCMIRSRHSHLMNIVRKFAQFEILLDENFLYNENWKYHILAVQKK